MVIVSTLSTFAYANQPGFLHKNFREFSSQESLGYYIQWLQSRGISSTTIKTYLSWVKKFLGICCATNEIYSAFPRDKQIYMLVTDYKTKLIQEEGCCPQSTNNAMSAVDSFCHYLNVPPPVIPRELKPDSGYPVLTRSEVNDVFNALLSFKTSVRDRAIVLIFLTLGLSLKNCRGLNVQDIQISPDRMRIKLEYGVQGRRQSVYIQAESTLGAALLQWLSAREQFGDDEPALFLALSGQRLSINSFDALVRKIGWKARVPVSIKLLRDTCVHFGKMGIDLEGNV